MAAEPARFALARETVRHVGEPVAAVVAATLAQAVDAAERLEVDYAPLSAVTDARAAQAEAAPQLHACAEGNVCFRWARGDEAAVRAALRSAAHVVAIDLVNNRLVGAAIEPRAVIGAVDPQSEKLTLYSSTQAPHHIRRQVTEQLGIPESALRVVSPDVGGVRGNHRLGRLPAAPSRALGRKPRRKLCCRQSGSRSPHACEARARCRRPFPRAARSDLDVSSADRDNPQRRRIDGRACPH
jgi:CO/xanthine dehydrogenase Mo-binding subunit